MAPRASTGDDQAGLGVSLRSPSARLRIRHHQDRKEGWIHTPTPSTESGRIVHGYHTRVDESALAATVASCKALIDSRFPDDGDHGAAAMLLGDTTILTGTAPDAVNASVEVCHEIEPFCGAYRLNQRVVASVCLHRQLGGRTVVLSPCGVCRERLAVYGPGVLVAVADRSDPTVVVWKTLRDVLPDYWMTAFPDEIDAGWTTT
jgi:cytidine deaminase